MYESDNDYTPNIPDFDLLTDVIVTPQLQVGSYEYVCPSILAGANKKETTSVKVMADSITDGGGV
jgi:hypothetical protein